MNNINVYTTIASMDGQEKYKLSALLNDDNTYCMSSLDFIPIKPEHSTYREYWDNEEYLFGDEFYEVVKLWVLDKKVDKGEHFSEICKYIPIEDFSLIYEILERGVKLGFKEKI